MILVDIGELLELIQKRIPASVPDLVDNYKQRPYHSFDLLLLRDSDAMISTLRALANLIVQQVDLIESTCEEKGLSLPSVDEPFSPQAETARNDPQISRAVTLLSAAANEIALVARPPQATVLMKALGVC